VIRPSYSSIFSHKTTVKDSPDSSPPLYPSPNNDAPLPAFIERSGFLCSLYIPLSKCLPHFPTSESVFIPAPSILFTS